MRVCILNASDGTYGGFSAAVRLHKNLRSYGFDSKMLVAKKQSGDSDVIEVSRFKYYFSRMLTRISDRILSRFVKGYKQEYYCDPYSRTFVNTAELVRKMPFTPDVIIANWINGFISAKQLSELQKATGAPVIWYLMDMAPFTGGCHFAWDCSSYESQCGCCPAIGSTNPRDASYRLWKYKYKYLLSMNIVVVSGTQWLYDQATRSGVFKNKRHEKILLSVNENIFKPVEKTGAKEVFNLPSDEKVLFFGAKAISEKRKGMSYLFRALDELLDLVSSSTKITLLIAGSEEEIKENIDNRYKALYLGYIKGDEALASAYQCADVYLSPSIEDSGPMMINESLMCGTPVVSFDIGVANELIVNGESGYKVKLYDYRGFAEGIKKLLNVEDLEREAISARCREKALVEFSTVAQAESFDKLFKDLLVAESALE